MVYISINVSIEIKADRMGQAVGMFADAFDIAEGKQRTTEKAKMKNELGKDYLYDRLSDALLEWRKREMGDVGSGCPFDAIVVLAARLNECHKLIKWHEKNEAMPPRISSGIL
jgi:hypothetical protein